MDLTKVGSQAFLALGLGALLAFVLPLGIALAWKFIKKEKFAFSVNVCTLNENLCEHETPTEPRGVKKINEVQRKRRWCLVTIPCVIR